MKPPRISSQTLSVLERFAERPSGWHYGYELSRETGLKSGTLYPILLRLSKYGMLETKWITTEKGVPPRHTYRLTAKGVAVFSKAVAQVRPPLRAGRLAPSEGKA
jgi:DNA-binding PadR family transcriptional regulator